MGEATVKASYKNPLDSPGEAGPPGPLGCQTAFPGPALPKLIRNRHWSFAPLGGGVQKFCISQVLLARALGWPSGRFSRHHASPKGRCARPRARLAHKLRASDTDIAASKKEPQQAGGLFDLNE